MHAGGGLEPKVPERTRPSGWGWLAGRDGSTSRSHRSVSTPTTRPRCACRICRTLQRSLGLGLPPASGGLATNRSGLPGVVGRLASEISCLLGVSLGERTSQGTGGPQPPLLLRPRKTASRPKALLGRGCPARSAPFDFLAAARRRGAGTAQPPGPAHPEPFPGRMLFVADPARSVTPRPRRKCGRRSPSPSRIPSRSPSREQVSGAPGCGNRWAWQRWRPCGEASFGLAPCSACPAWRSQCCCWCSCQTPPR